MKSSEEVVDTVACPNCVLCGKRGNVRHRGVRDRLFGVAGRWDLRQCSDPDCGVLWPDPMPVPGDIPKLYEAYYTHADDTDGRIPWSARILRRAAAVYRAQRYGDPYPGGFNLPFHIFGFLLPGHRERWDYEAYYLPARSGGRLLEVGCGGGTMLKIMADRGWDVVGVDFDSKAVENARAKDLTVLCGSLEDHHLPDDSFNAVVMNHLIEHVPNPGALLKECYRVLAPGGDLIAVTPNAEGWGHQIFGPDWRGLEPPRHLQIFTPQALGRLARQAGFDHAETNTVVANGHGIFLYSRQLRRDDKVSSRISPFARATARILQFLQWHAIRFRPAAGEEILLRALKTPVS